MKKIFALFGVLLAACGSQGTETVSLPLITITTAVSVSATDLNEGVLRDQLGGRCGFSTDSGILLGPAQTPLALETPCNAQPQEVWHLAVTALFADGGTLTLPVREGVSYDSRDALFMGDVLGCGSSPFTVDTAGVITGPTFSQYALPGIIGDGQVIELRSAVVSTLEATVSWDCVDTSPSIIY